MDKLKEYVLGWIVLFFLLITSVGLFPGKSEAASYPGSWTQSQGNLGSWNDGRLVIAGSAGADKTLGKFTFTPQYFKKQTKVSIGGVLVNPSGEEQANIDPVETAKKGGVDVQYAGVYNGRIVDMKINFGPYLWADGSARPSGAVFRLGVTPDAAQGFLGAARIGDSYKSAELPFIYSFTDHDTGKPIAVTGFFTYADIDNNEGYRIDNNLVKYVSVRSNNVVNYAEDSNYFYLYSSMGKDVVDIKDQTQWAQIFYEGLTSIEVDFVADTTTNGFVTGTLAAADFQKPLVYGDQTNSNIDDEKLEYGGIFSLPYRDSELGYPSKYEATLNYESVLNDPQDVSVTNVVDGSDATNLFDISVGSGKIQLKLKNTKEESVYANSYRVTYSTSVKSGQDISDYFKDGKYKFPITASVNYGAANPLESDTEYATLPSQFNPELTKSVRNVTAKETAFKTDTDAHLNDEVEYKVHLKNTSQIEIPSGISLNDSLDANLQSVGNVNITYEDGSADQQADLSGQITLDHPLAAGKSIDAIFKAKVVSDTKNTIQNTASVTYNGETRKTNESNLNIIVPDATVTHELKNETTPDKDFSDSTEGSKDDIITYRYTIDQIKTTQETPYLDAITDQTDDLELTNDPIQVVYTPPAQPTVNWTADATEFKDNHKIQLHDNNVKVIEKGGKVVVTYKMKIISDDVNKVITNNAASGVKLPVISNDTKLTTKLGVGNVTFNYIDRKTGNAIGEGTVKVTGKINQAVSATTAADNDKGLDPNKIRPSNIDGYTGVDYTDDGGKTYKPLKDLDPVIDKDAQNITFRYEKASLHMDGVPERFDFGEYLKQQADRTYYLKAQQNSGQKEPYGVTVSDYYGVKNWQLSVKQDSQFEGITKSNKINQLDGAQLQFTNGQATQIDSGDNLLADSEKKAMTVTSAFNLVPAGSEQQLMTYTKKGSKYLSGAPADTSNEVGSSNDYENPGYSVWHYQFGKASSADYSIGLHVPATAKREKMTYKSTLTWTLSVAP